MKPWTPEVREVADAVVAQIREAVPELEVLFMGAAALGLPGKNDIDLDILCPAADIEASVVKLEPVLGEPKERKVDLAAWSFERDGYEVDCIISDPKTSHVPAQKRVFDALKADPALLEEYRQLKVECDGLPYDEYEKRKKEFYATVIDEDRG